MNLNIHKVSLSIKGRIIVNKVSITVNPGEVVGLMGPNGAGKTTTFNLAVGNIKPDKGEILMKGKNITNLPLAIRSRLGPGY
jgi:ABC-type (unclassified) transport system, ATPase component